jgi:hypothetical protein
VKSKTIGAALTVEEDAASARNAVPANSSCFIVASLPYRLWLVDFTLIGAAVYRNSLVEMKPGPGLSNI